MWLFGDAFSERMYNFLTKKFSVHNSIFLKYGSYSKMNGIKKYFENKVCYKNTHNALNKQEDRI